jgi:phosphoglucosamine mutase
MQVARTLGGMARLFGTDGVRGLANQDLTAELALNLAVAAAGVLAEAGEFAGHRPTAVVGRDPRASGEFLEAAVVAGLASAGLDVYLVGVAPTPAVAFITATQNADIGVMISASHNPMPDNGIKFFARGGVKLDDAVEDAIEDRMGAAVARPVGAAVGRVIKSAHLVEKYVEHLLAATSVSLKGLKVVVDAANGAASAVAPLVYEKAGAEVIQIHCSPDGLNINENCGSTHMSDLQKAVVEHGAHVGVAHDGDADRFLAVDAAGEIVDGDQIIAIIAIGLKEHGLLAKNTIVGTVMANLGFKIAMQREGINLIETAVGDRYVLEAMRAGNFNLGGEQSGHVILSDHASTGDGTLTALLMLARMAETKKSLAELASVMQRMPQVLINVKDVDKSRVHINTPLRDIVSEVERELGENGRVLLRPSGTEALVRVMVEAQSAELAQSCADRIASVVRSELTD